MRLLFTVLLVWNAATLKVFGSSGDSKGNGGNGVVCRDKDNKIISTEILDFYEAREFRGIELDLGDPSLSVDHKIQLALGRLDRLEFRGKHLLKKARAFSENALFKTGIVLVNIADTNHLGFPQGCRVEQIINQRQPFFPEDKRYVVSKDLWDHLDNNNKAGLILHEVIYGELIAQGQTLSDGARYFNSYITSLKIEDLKDRRQYFKLLALAGFRDYWWHNVPLALSDAIACGENCHSAERLVFQGIVSKPTEISIGPGGPNNLMYKLTLTADCRVYFHVNGKIHEGCFEIESDFPRIKLANFELRPGKKVHLWFHEDFNTPIGLEFPGVDTIHSVDAGVSGWLSAKGSLRFYPDGHLHMLILANEAPVKTSAGDTQLLKVGTLIEFDKTGQALRWDNP